MITTAAAL